MSNSDRHLSAKQRSRATHPGFDSDDHCTRCGLFDDDQESRLRDNCPVGFWMTKAERDAWTKGVRYVDE